MFGEYNTFDVYMNVYFLTVTVHHYRDFLHYNENYSQKTCTILSYNENSTKSTKTRTLRP